MLVFPLPTGVNMALTDIAIKSSKPRKSTLLRSLQTLTGHSPLPFPGERDHQMSMSNNTILGALDRMGYAGRMTGHGFRGIGSTLLHEQGWPHEHIELQLAHQARNQVSASYNHAMYLLPRAQMMQA